MSLYTETRFMTDGPSGHCVSVCGRDVVIRLGEQDRYHLNMDGVPENLEELAEMLIAAANLIRTQEKTA